MNFSICLKFYCKLSIVLNNLRFNLSIFFNLGGYFFRNWQLFNRFSRLILIFSIHFHVYFYFNVNINRPLRKCKDIEFQDKSWYQDTLNDIAVYVFAIDAKQPLCYFVRGWQLLFFVLKIRNIWKHSDSETFVNIHNNSETFVNIWKHS